MFRELAFISLLFAGGGASQAITVTAPGTLPSGASQIVDHSFLGLAMEVASFADYAGKMFIQLRFAHANSHRE